MEELLDALEQAYTRYRQDIETYERKSKPTDGLLGFGRSLKDDACHERFDERIAEAVSAICGSKPAPEAAERAVRALIAREDTDTWPIAAQWMLRAVERHSMPLLAYLSPEAANALSRQYASRYKPWDRLPAQKQVLKALKAAGKEKP